MLTNSTRSIIDRKRENQRNSQTKRLCANKKEIPENKTEVLKADYFIQVIGFFVWLSLTVKAH
jgi:hypothetical protein